MPAAAAGCMTPEPVPVPIRNVQITRRRHSRTLCPCVTYTEMHSQADYKHACLQVDESAQIYLTWEIEALLNVNRAQVGDVCHLQCTLLMVCTAAHIVRGLSGRASTHPRREEALLPIAEASAAQTQGLQVGELLPSDGLSYRHCTRHALLSGTIAALLHPVCTFCMPVNVF